MCIHYITLSLFQAFRIFSQEDDEAGENNANIDVDIEAENEDDDEEDLELLGKKTFQLRIQ